MLDPVHGVEDQAQFVDHVNDRHCLSHASKFVILHIFLLPLRHADDQDPEQISNEGEQDHPDHSMFLREILFAPDQEAE